MKTITLEFVDAYVALVSRVMNIAPNNEHQRAHAEQYLFWVCSTPRSAMVSIWNDDQLLATGYMGPSTYRTSAHYCTISKVMVDPSSRNKGLGTLLINSLEKEAKGFGYTDIMLDTWDIPKVVEFYRRHGYSEVGILPHYVKGENGKYYDSHIFVKSIGDLE